MLSTLSSICATPTALWVICPVVSSRSSCHAYTCWSCTSPAESSSEPSRLKAMQATPNLCSCSSAQSAPLVPSQMVMAGM